MSPSIAISRADPGSAGAVKAVSVISTGTVQIRPEHPYGTRKPLYWWLLTSRQWTPPRPINVYVIEHAKGLILFDTGQDRASVTDDQLPGVGNRRRLAESSRKVLALAQQQPGLAVLPAHDPIAAQRLMDS
jgi:hypothetical protein